MDAMRWRICGACGPILGSSQMIVRSILLIVALCAFRISTDFSKKMALSMFLNVLSDGGKCWPISPSPIAPRMASVIVCRATSASEWPFNGCEWGMSMPPMRIGPDALVSKA